MYLEHFGRDLFIFVLFIGIICLAIGGCSTYLAQSYAAGTTYTDTEQIVVEFSDEIVKAECKQHLLDFWLSRDADNEVWRDLLLECISNEHYEDAAVYMSVLWDRQRKEVYTELPPEEIERLLQEAAKRASVPKRKAKVGR